MNFFLEFDSLTPLGSGLLAEASGPMTAAMVLKANTPINEMGFLQPGVGKVRGCSIANGIVKVAVELWDKIAVSKTAARVYHGLCLVGFAHGDEVTIERVALVDHPEALGKRSGVNPALSLRMDWIVKMSLSPSTEKRIEFGKTAESNGRVIDINKQREAAQPALEMLRQFFRDNKGGNGTHPFLRSAK
jgi:hypothetical protein